MGSAEGEDGGLGRIDFVLAVGELGGNDGGEGVGFDEVLLSGVEGGDRDIAQTPV